MYKKSAGWPEDWEKVAQTVAKSKNAKTSPSKLNLKVQKIYTKPLLNSYNTYNKP